MQLLIGTYAVNAGGAASIRGELKLKEPPLKDGFDITKPRTWSGDQHDPNTLEFELKIDVATHALALAEITSLRANLAYGKQMTATQTDGTSYSVTIIGGVVDPILESPEDYELATHGTLFCDVAIAHTPYWLGIEKSQTATITGLFGYADITGVLGDVPAYAALLFTTAQASKGFAIGLRSNPGASFTPCQDYDAHALDATAKGGKVETVALDASTFDASSFAAGAATLDANAFRAPNGAPGRYATYARWLQDATTDANVKVYAHSSVTGSGIASTSPAVPASPVSVASTAAVPTAAGFEVARVGDVTVPGAAVPGIAAGVGYADESAAESNTTAASKVGGAGYPSLGQTFPVAAGSIHTGITLKLHNLSASVMTAWIKLYATSGGLPTGSILAQTGPTNVPGDHDGEIRFAWQSAPRDLPAGTYALVTALGTYLEVYYDAGAGYASGGAVRLPAGGLWEAGAPGDDTADLYFKSHTQTPLGFNCTTAIGACIAAAEVSDGHTFKLDQVALLPIDEGACIYTPASAFAADEGTLTDALNPDGSVDVYRADHAGGVAASVIGSGCEVWGNPRPRPGVTNRYVCAAYTPSDAAPGDGTLKVTYREAWLTPPN